MYKLFRSLLGLIILASLLLSASPASAVTYGEAAGSGDFYADDTGTVTPGGRGHFTFVAKIKEQKGPIGQLEFRYPLDNLKLKSTAYNFITFNGPEVIVAGQCIKDNLTACTFQMVVFDGEVDFFSLAITEASGTAVYQGFLAGGKIEIASP